ncbi:hypothetical protein AMK25_17640 [Micromonospora sp. TSRI0369]|nr:hypothetical protein AMK25_17640 [Micromonospora sp. TSRI0369]
MRLTADAVQFVAANLMIAEWWRGVKGDAGGRCRPGIALGVSGGLRAIGACRETPAPSRPVRADEPDRATGDEIEAG